MSSPRRDAAWRTQWRALLEKHFSEVDRLRALGVEMRELNPGRTSELTSRFIREFSAADQVDGALATLERGDGLAFEKWLRDDCVVREPGNGAHLRWLSGGALGAECLRLARRGDLPAVEIVTHTMDDAWAKTWPGVFCHFALGRALVVSLDYQLLRLDLHARRATPYR